MTLWSRYQTWRLRHVRRIEVAEDGFSMVSAGDLSERVGWADIVTIHAYKRDLYTVDMVCLLIAAQEGSVLEVNEQMQGYPELVERIDAMLGTLVACQLHVMFPAFETNLTQIYPANAR